MRNLKAVRLSLKEVQITDPTDTLIGTIHYPVAKMWKTENALISDQLGDSFQTDLSLIIEGQKFLAKRKLLPNNENEISLLNEKNEVVAQTTTVRFHKTLKIHTDSGIYEFVRHGLFRFRFDLLENKRIVARFSETTSFFSVTSRKQFLIAESVPTPAVVLTFSFFLAHNWFY